MTDETIELNFLGIKRVFDKETLNTGDKFSYLKIKEGTNEIIVDYESNMLLKIIKTELEKFDELDVYIDIGSYIGDTTLLLQKGFCFSFEPSKRNFNNLLKNISLNPQLKIIPINVALHNSEFYYEMINSGEGGTLDLLKISTKMFGNKTATIDNLFNNFGLKIKLIKIDAEGCDYAILEGAQKTIEKFKPIIIIEKFCLYTSEYANHIEKFLLDNNYEVSSINSVDILGKPK